ncbi:MAG: 50S ribosomal protein L18 [Fibrobacteres bacterium]|jgi:large subunit ribosomal protein L18|nr:50S ribosomal protein L18 [Fibrobacterota bacterium]
MFADKALIRRTGRIARHDRIRKKIDGTAARPRLSVRRSLSHIYAQIIDDVSGKSLLNLSSLSPEVKAASEGKKKTEVSKELGKLVAQKAIAAGIKNVVFDRGGYLFHGRVKAVADAAREAGLEF